MFNEDEDLEDAIADDLGDEEEGGDNEEVGNDEEGGDDEG